ncbi:MAG TPA: NapC/NirT family cytochrome c [Anaerolineales bacterium]
MLRRLKTTLRNFFFPPRGSARWLLILPYAVLGALTISLLVGGAFAWDYTNSPSFCGTSCHTMPPEYAAYQASPHARIACVECHIGREFIGNQIFRKAGDVRHIVAMTFQTYEYPIRVKNMRPARETCERCHTPEKFSDDSLRTIAHYGSDKENTPYEIYLVLKTGGGAKREGLGRGIHWHIVNQVYYYTTDPLEQTIPYVSVVNDDGSTTDYVDVESGVDPAKIDRSQLKEMDCITCHNRITHLIHQPEESMDNAMSIGVISPDIPEIRARGVEVLRAGYASHDEAMKNIQSLDAYYQTHYSGFYGANTKKVKDAIAALQEIYSTSVFPDQKVDWNTHPSNVGHFDSAGCFRCHDGKHLDKNQSAIRLECNLCHSIPVVAGTEDFVTKIEISRGPEPESHRNPNWISLHNAAIDNSCSACHTTEDAGGTSNTSFCSNSACHGNVYTYAGFDAPKLREILQSQLPAPAPTPMPGPAPENPTYDANIGALLGTKCGVCHNATTLAGGMDVTTFASLMKGGKDGAVIIAGDAAASLLVQVQSAQHFANLSAAELELVQQWITAGAPEK